MATFNKSNTAAQTTAPQVEATATKEDRVTSCRLAHDSKRPFVVAYSGATVHGKVFINGIQVREAQNGNAYTLLPGYRATGQDGTPLMDENGYQKFINYVNPADKETRESMNEMIFDAVQKVMDGTANEREDIKYPQGSVRVYMRNNDNHVANVSIQMDGFWAMRSIQVRESKAGDAYLSFPADYSKDLQKEFPHCGPATKELRASLENLIMPEVQKLLDEAGTR